MDAVRARRSSSLERATRSRSSSLARLLIAGALASSPLAQLRVGPSGASSSSGPAARPIGGRQDARIPGTVIGSQKIIDHEAVAAGDSFGSALVSLGDLNGDGNAELAVGMLADNTGGDAQGAVYVLFLDPQGGVASLRKISDITGGFSGDLQHRDEFGNALANLGDLDGDGNPDLAVGEENGANETTSSSEGVVWILFLNSDGSVKAHQRIAPNLGGFTGTVRIGDHFGSALAALGDVDGDGVGDLAVGAHDDGDGAVWILFLNADGTVKAQGKIGAPAGSAHFGGSLASLRDLDGDGTRELAVGEVDRLSLQPRTGKVHVLFLLRNGTVNREVDVGDGLGGFTGALDPGDDFGSCLADLGDFDGDGVDDLGVGAWGDDDGGPSAGAIWLLGLNGVASLDFESGDDLARTPLVDGQAVASPREFGRTVALASAGRNLGPAIFDSTARDPKVRGTNRALSVGLGNVLLLQDPRFPRQTVPGIFDHPDDADEGGTLAIAFRGPIAPYRIDLVDIDKAFVRLFDAGGATRQYTIPHDWTGNLVRNGPPGFRTLDLTTLDPQPGFRTSAVASESGAFDANAVVRLEIQLFGSGAIDNLHWEPHP